MGSFFGNTFGKSSPQDLFLAQREGTKPKTIYSVPHAQVDQESSEEMFERLRAWIFSLPHIEYAPSTGSFPSAFGAMIKRNFKGKTNTISGREWTHIHVETGYGSMHALMTGANAYEVVQKGWGEYHPLNRNAKPNQREAVVMIYSPRDVQDLEEIKKILASSYEHVLGTPLAMTK